MPRCDPNDAIPRTCAENFQRITGALERQDAKLDAIHEQTTKTNGHVDDLFTRTNDHAMRITTLEGSDKDRATWGKRLWGVFIGIVLVILAALVAYGLNT